jgi:hypothetical protein
MSDLKKICVVGVHGTGKSKICEKVKNVLYNNFFTKEKLKINSESTYGPTEIHYAFKNQFAFIPEQFREIAKDIPNFTKQTEEITLATYGKQLYLENLYTAQGKNILCDRSVLDTFVYYNYFNKIALEIEDIIDQNIIFELGNFYNDLYDKNPIYASLLTNSFEYITTYSKIYLIEPSDREIENDGFRMTDKKQQLEIHKLFLEYFENVVIVNQEEQDKIVEMIVNDFSIL